MLESINKLIDKPIIIERKKSDSETFEEKEEIDYIAESKTLKDL